MHRAISAGILAYFVLVPGSARADDKADELVRQQGKWVVTSMIRDDREADPAIRASITRTVSDEHVVWKRDGKSFAGTRIVLNPAQTPNHIDLIPDGGPATDKHVLGIYRFDGETLIICMSDPGQPRPTAFGAKPGSKQTLQSFKRAQP